MAQEVIKGKAEEKLEDLQNKYTEVEVQKLSAEDNSYTMALGGLLFTIVCILLPIRMLVHYCFSKGDGEDG